MLRRLALALLCSTLVASVIGVAGVAGVARADGVADEAELHFQLAAEKYIARDFRGALEHFLLSNRLAPNKNVVFNIARTYEQLERFADAHRYYVEALSGEADPKIRTQLEASLARIAPKVAILDVITDPPGATIYVDRKDLGTRGTSPRALAFPAGNYRVLVELAGFEPLESAEIDAVLGTTVPVALKLVRIEGQVTVDAGIGTTVHVDREDSAPACLSPCTLSLPPGTHTLFLKRAGHQTSTKLIAVTAHETTVVKAALSPLTGSLVVSADERDALVEIDERSVGFTPVVVSNIAVGPRRVRVSLRGFQPIEKVVDVVANQQTELTELRLDPVAEVTAASRFTENIEDAPSSVTIIPFEELRAFDYPTVAEAVRGVRGFSVSNDAIYEAFNIRGIGQPNDYGNRVLILSDGLVLNDNIVSSSYIGYDGRVDLRDLEQIEIVRGAGSLLYGTGAISGVINLVTKSRDAPANIHVVAGTADNSVGRVRAGFKLDFARDAGLWTSVAFARSDGRTATFGESPPVATSSTTAGLEKFDAATVAGRAWWGPITAQWFYTARNQHTPFGPYGTVFGDPNTRSKDRRAAAEVRFEPSLGSYGDLLFRAHANLYAFDGRFVYPSSQNDESYEGQWFGLEARWVLTPLEDPRALRISLGGTGERHAIATLHGETISGAQTAIYLEEDHPYTLGAAYAVAESSPAEFIRLTGGLRLDIYSTFGATLNPRASVILRPWNNGILKIFGGRAFRAPSVYELHYNDRGVSQIKNADLEPETSYSGEVEYSHRIFRDWIALIAGHVNYLENIIDTAGEGTAISPLQYVNRSDAVVTGGGELELRREWRRGWMISASYGFERVKNLINAPAHLASIKGAVPIVPSLALLAARVAFESPRRIRLSDDEESDAAVVADVVVSGKVERYGLSYSAGVYNLFDWRYQVPITEGAISETLPQSGRTFLFTLELNVNLTGPGS